jgi:anti-anti-sigma factor
MELLKTELMPGDPAVLEIVGEIDLSTADQLRAVLEDAVSGDSKLVVDMAGVTFCDATGLRVVLQTAESLNGAGPLRLLHASRVKRLLELVGLSELSSIEMSDAGDPHVR